MVVKEDLRNVLKELGPEILRQELGEVSRYDGIMGGTPLRVYPDTHQGIHFYAIADLIAAGELASDYWPENLCYKPRSGTTLTPYSYDLTERTLRLSGDLVAKGSAPVAFGMMRTMMRFVERKGTKSVGLSSYPYFKLELTKTTFRVKTWNPSPPYGYETETTDLTFKDTYLNSLNVYNFLLYPNLAVFMIENDPATLTWHTKGVSNIGTAPVITCPPDSEMRVQWIDFAVFTDLLKWQPPPLTLWSSQTIDVVGANSRQVPAHPYSTKTFHLLSNQNGNVQIQVDFGDGVWRNFGTATAVAANTLWSYQTTYDARFMRLNFVPAAPATVSAWALLKM